MDCIIIRVVDLPFPLKGATVLDNEGDYNVYLNAKLSSDERVKAYRHEIEHIRLGHFYQDRPVADMEKEAEQYGKGKENEERQVDDAGIRLHGSAGRSAL